MRDSPSRVRVHFWRQNKSRGDCPENATWFSWWIGIKTRWIVPIVQDLQNGFYKVISFAWWTGTRTNIKSIHKEKKWNDHSRPDALMILDSLTTKRNLKIKRWSVVNSPPTNVGKGPLTLDSNVKTGNLAFRSYVRSHWGPSMTFGAQTV